MDGLGHSSADFTAQRQTQNSDMVEPQNTTGITVYDAPAFGDQDRFKMGTVPKKKRGAVVAPPNNSSPDTVCPDEGVILSTGVKV